MGKTVSGCLKEEIKEAADPLQVCAGHNAGAEAAIHAMSQVFVEEGTDGILLIDASNAFNQMSRSAALHNIQIMCKEIAHIEAHLDCLSAGEVKYFLEKAPHKEIR